jgi:hypothetical protein
MTDGGRDAQKNALTALAIALLGSLLFVGSLDHQWTMDDDGLITKNRLSRGVEQLPEIFRTDYWYPTMESGLYRPLAKASYVLNWELGRLDPRGFHLFNVLLHGAVCAVVFILLLQVTADRVISSLAALLFAVHAAHTEVVANITFGRPELIAALLSLLCAVAYLGIRDNQAWPQRAWRLGASMLALFLAMLSKESAVTILGVIGLYDVCYRTSAEHPLWRRIWLTLQERTLPYYVGLCASVGGYLLLRVVALTGQKPTPPHIQIDNPIVGLDQPWRIVNALYVALRYVWLLIFPNQMSYDYSFDAIPLITSAADPKLWVTLMLVALCVGGTFWAYRHHRTVFFGAVFFLLTFSVVSNVFVLIGTIFGDRLIYFPSVGFCLVAAVGLRELSRRLAGENVAVVLVPVMAVVLGLHMWRAVERTADWVDEYTLYTHDVEVVPGSTKAQNNSGAIRIKAKEYEEGLAQLRRAIEISPLGYHVPYYTAGLTLTTLGRDEEAMEMYEASILGGDQDPFTKNNLGYILIDHEVNVERGITLIEEAIVVMPKNAEFRDSLAWGYFKNGDLERARATMQVAIELDEAKGKAVDGRRERLDLIENAIRLREIATTPRSR